ncbi:MAG: patatin-like phospholipase family protein [Pseudomonadota bacterium]
MNEHDQPDYSTDFEPVHAAERDWLAARRRAAGLPDSNDTVGLALSGGGIRSAAFNLGVLSALAQRGLLKQVDYLSSVSGGGYIAACLSWLCARLPGHPRPFTAGTTRPGDTVLDWVRAHGKYLVAERGFSGWTLGASILAATLLNLLVMLPPLLLAIGAAARDWLPFGWPAWVKLGAAGPLEAHDGFVLMFWAGLASLGLYLVAVVGFAFVSGLPLLRSSAGLLRARRLMGFCLNAGLALLAIGLLPVVTAVEEWLASSLARESSQLASKALVAVVPLASGLAALRRADNTQRKGGGDARTLATAGLALVTYALMMLAYHVVVHAGPLESRWLWVAVALSLTLAVCCDLNQVSMHSYYRARLARAFMPPLAGADGAPTTTALRFRLADIDPATGAPLHLVNTTVNTLSADAQKLNARGGDSFFFSPVYSGSSATGYRTTRTYQDGRTTLSTAFTISGAAVDPNTAETRSRPIAFLMALLNLRLGFWAPNPAARQRRLPFPWWYLFIGREMSGHGLSGATRDVHLSDGGHFDNLGLYELLRRGCRRIVVSDAGADPETTLSDLGLVIQRARDDFGAHVDLCADHLWQQAQLEISEAPFAVGSIAYADGSRGSLLYLKPMMRTGLTADIYAYWRDNPAFPNQSTANQFFGEQQFNAYVGLGQQLVTGLAGDAAVSDFDTLVRRAAEALAARVAEPALAPVPAVAADRDACTATEPRRVSL